MERHSDADGDIARGTARENHLGHPLQEIVWDTVVFVESALRAVRRSQRADLLPRKFLGSAFQVF